MKKFFLIVFAVLFVGLQGGAAFVLSWRNPHFLFKRAQMAYNEKDYPSAIELLEIPVKKGSIEAMKLAIQCHYEHGLYLAEKKKLEEACKYWQKAAQYSFAPAEYALANCYAEGDGVSKDLAKAIELYRLASEHGNDEAKEKWLSFGSVQLDLGRQAFAKEDFKAAMEHFKKARDLGDAEAFYFIAQCFELGKGTEMDVEKAIALYAEGAKQNDAKSKEKWLSFASVQFALGEQAFAQKQYQEAIACFELAAQKGDHNAKDKLAEAKMAVAMDLWKQQNYGEAFKAFLEADKAGAKEAPLYLGECYEKGFGTDMDEKKAMAAYLKSSKNGSKIASERWMKLVQKQQESESIQ